MINRCTKCGVRLSGREHAHPVGLWIPWAMVTYRIMNDATSPSMEKFFRLWWKALVGKYE